MSSAHRHLSLPLAEQTVRSLVVGDLVCLSGALFTARDAVHHFLAGGGTPPCDLSGAVIYHCGPVVVREDGRWRVTAAGPTTSIREEPYMAGLIARFGLRAVIGKGGMGQDTLQACGRHGCVYLHAIGGAAQVLAARVAAVDNVYLREEFGDPEAVWELQVTEFPALVTMDTHGCSLHDEVAAASAARLTELMPGLGV